MSPDPTVRSRLTSAGLSPARIAEHLAAGQIRLDGVRVTDLEQAAPPGSRLVLGVGDGDALVDHAPADHGVPRRGAGPAVRDGAGAAGDVGAGAEELDRSLD